MTDLAATPHRPELRWAERVVLLALGVVVGLLLAGGLAGRATPNPTAAPETPILSGSAPTDLGGEPEPPIVSVISELAGVQSVYVRHYDRTSICAILVDSTVRCAGEDGWGELDPPPGLRLIDVKVGHDTSCGVAIDGTLACWGANSGEVRVPGGFDQFIGVSDSMFCALRSDGGVSCFEFGDRDWTRSGWTLTNDPFLTADASPNLLCGVRADGGASCVSPYRGGSSADVERFASPADMELALIRVGDETACGLDREGRPACWGRNGPITRDAPNERFVDLSLDWSRACGLRADGTVTCWGENAWTWSDSPSDLYLTSLVMAEGQGVPCGTTHEGRIACWGWQGGDFIHELLTEALNGL
jgi:hypothetical protein